MTAGLTRRGLLATVGLAATAGCLGSVLDGETDTRGGTTEGAGFSSREFGSHPAAPMVRYDAANTGVIPDATGPTATPAETWQTEETLGTPARPTTLKDIVFTNSTNGVAGFTTAGERRWAYRTNDDDLDPAPPVVVGDRVYAARTTALFALDAKIGTERWVFTPPRSTNRLAAPAVAGDTVYVLGQHPEQPPTLWAVARLDGSVRWQVELEGETAAPPVVAAGTVYCVTTNGGLYAVDVTDQSIAWTRSLSPVAGPPAVGATGVFVPTAEGVTAYATDGEDQWQTASLTAPSDVHGGLAVRDGTVYAASRDESALVALAADTGDEQWRVAHSGDVRSPVVTDETVYAQDTAGAVRALSPADGTERWSTRLPLREMTGITVTEGGLIVGTDEQLVRYD